MKDFREETQLLYRNDNPKNKTRGATIGLMTLYDEMGAVPHPRSLCNNPGRLQEVWIALTKNYKGDNKLQAIPHILDWHGTDIGYYGFDDYTGEDGFVSVAEDENERPDEDTRFYVFWE